MRKTLIIIIIVFLFGGIILFFSNENNKNNIENIQEEEHVIINETKIEETYSNQETMNNLLKHIGFAEEALSKIHITSAEECVDLWVQGILSGNGVLQYAVMDKSLQEEFKVYLQKEENLSWDTRREDETIEYYEIIQYTDVSEKVKICEVRFDYINSQGLKSEAFNRLTLVEENGRWVLSAIR